jgi:DNA repair exonuclease SbcCD ATPase subunit
MDQFLDNPILVAKIDALQKDVDRLLEHNLQMRHMLELILEQRRPHQRQLERISMNFKTLRQFEEFNGELKENLQKKKQFGSIISHIHTTYTCKYNAIFIFLSS